MTIDTQIDGLELANLNTPDDATDEEVARVGLGWLETQRDVLCARLAAEREAGIPPLADLEKQLTRAQKSLEKLETKQKKAKRAAKLRKQEIAEWKQWYEGVAAVERDSERETLAAEIGWRSEAIVAQEAKVGQLELEILAAEDAVVALEDRIEAVKAGVFDRPLEEDPRLVELEKAILKVEKQAS